MVKIRIQPNTDSVDIDQKCLGVDAWIDGDSTNQLNTNRGLHIQIRHNKDKDQFEAANAINKLISAAPEMLSVLELVMSDKSYTNGVGRTAIARLIKKVKGQ